MKGWLRAHGMTFGNVVSAHASGKYFTDAELAILGADKEESTDAPSEPVADEVTDGVTETDDTTVAATTEDRGSRGNGNGKAAGGNGNGGGNGKN